MTQVACVKTSTLGSRFFCTNISIPSFFRTTRTTQFWGYFYCVTLS